MKKLSGQCTLEEFFISMTKSDTLMNKYNGFIYEFNLFKKLRNDSFIKEILIKPIIFYLKVDSFANSGENIKIDEIIKDIVATEDYNILCFLNNLSALKKREFTINFIAIQIDNQNNCSTKDIFNTILLKEIIEVEYFFLKGSTSGVIDIKRIEKNISNYITDNDFIGYIKNYQKNLFQQILKLQPKDKKVNYVKNEFKVIPNFELEYEKIGTTNCIFNIKCVICGKTHSVSINNKLKDVLKAKDFFDINENIVELKCGHKETKYFGMVRDAARQLGLISVKEGDISLAVDSKCVSSYDSMREYIVGNIDTISEGLFFDVSKEYTFTLNFFSGIDLTKLKNLL